MATWAVLAVIELLLLAGVTAGLLHFYAASSTPWKSLIVVYISWYEPAARVTARVHAPRGLVPEAVQPRSARATRWPTLMSHHPYFRGAALALTAAGTSGFLERCSCPLILRRRLRRSTRWL
ncbi:hypothetical protein EON66_03760 [archaeon]|nr:MAG: hypothetical protein EON66_03760 [archaeon]